MGKLKWLLAFAPIALIAELAHLGDLIIFVTSALAVIPLAGLMGEATEALAEKTGPRIGGLLNATLGNAAEMIITLFAIRAGLSAWRLRWVSSVLPATSVLREWVRI